MSVHHDHPFLIFLRTVVVNAVRLPSSLGGAFCSNCLKWIPKKSCTISAACPAPLAVVLVVLVEEFVVVVLVVIYLNIPATQLHEIVVYVVNQQLLQLDCRSRATMLQQLRVRLSNNAAACWSRVLGDNAAAWHLCVICDKPNCSDPCPNRLEDPLVNEIGAALFGGPAPLPFLVPWSGPPLPLLVPSSPALDNVLLVDCG